MKGLYLQIFEKIAIKVFSGEAFSFKALYELSVLEIYS